MKNSYGWLLLVTVAGICIAASGRIQQAKLSASIELERMNVFYIGVDNPIVINAPGVRIEELYPTIIGGSMRATEVPWRFIVQVNGGTKATIIVSRKSGEEIIPIDTFEYRIKKLQDPVTYINHVRNDGVILQEDLQKISGVFTRLENCDFDGAFMPVSFSMSLIEDSEWKEYKANGPALTEEMKTALQKCREEDKIIFHNVMTKGPAGDIRHVNCVTITVK